MMTIRDMTQPPGGWRYTVPETGLLVTAATASTLRVRILSHLAANGIDPPPDLNTAICRQMGLGEPYCSKARVAENAPPKYPKLTVDTANRFLKTMLAVIRDRRFVPREEAERRMAVCMSCPLATSLGLCVGCNGLASTVVRLLNGKAPRAEAGREWCAACGCRLDAKVMIPNATLDKGEPEKPDYWPGCWRLSSKENG